MGILFFLLACFVVLVVLALTVAIAYWALILSLTVIAMVVTFGLLSSYFGENNDGVALLLSIPVGMLILYLGYKEFKGIDEDEATAKKS